MKDSLAKFQSIELSSVDALQLRLPFTKFIFLEQIKCESNCF